MGGRPNINIEFKKLAQSAKARSANGIVVLILKDDTDKSFSTIEYADAADVEASKFTAENVGFIKSTLNGGIKKVIVSRVDIAAVTPVETAINNIGNVHYNWIGLAKGTVSEQTKLVELVKAMPKVSAVVFNNTADHERIVNFANSKVKPKESAEITGDKYVSRILGLIGGCPLTESTTLKILDDLESVSEPADVDLAVDEGKFVLFNDEGVVRVARGVNSLQNLGENKYADMKKITIMDTLSMIRRDIYSLFKDHYVGNYKNSYDNQVIFFVAVQDYLNQLSVEEILDKDSSNIVNVNVEKQRAELMKLYPEAAEWTEKKIKSTTVGSNVYPITNIKVNDAMEDLDFDILN